MSSFPFAGDPLGVQVGIAVGTGSVVALDVPAGSKFAAISVEAEPVRFRDDGTNPTPTTGVLLAVTTIPWLYASQAGLTRLRFVATTGTATLNVAFYG